MCVCVSECACNHEYIGVSIYTYVVNRFGHLYNLIPECICIAIGTHISVNTPFFPPTHVLHSFRKIFWHSSAHILGSALQEVCPSVMLADGPALKEGCATREKRNEICVMCTTIYVSVCVSAGRSCVRYTPISAYAQLYIYANLRL